MLCHIPCHTVDLYASKYHTTERNMKIALLICVIFCSFLLASSNPPLPPAIRVFLGLNYVFKEDVDLVHVVVSSSLNEEDFKLAKKAAKRLTRAANALSPIGEQGSHIGFVQVSITDETKEEFDLGQYNTQSDNIDAINDVAFIEAVGLPDIGDGLEKAKDMFNNDGNDNKVLWLVTKTVQYSGPNPMSLVQDLKDNGVRICVMYIGALTPVVKDRLESVASGKCYQVYNSYSEYFEIMKNASKGVVLVNQ